MCDVFTYLPWLSTVCEHLCAGHTCFFPLQLSKTASPPPRCRDHVRAVESAIPWLKPVLVQASTNPRTADQWHGNSQLMPHLAPPTTPRFSIAPRSTSVLRTVQLWWLGWRVCTICPTSPSGSWASLSTAWCPHPLSHRLLQLSCTLQTRCTSGDPIYRLYSCTRFPPACIAFRRGSQLLGAYPCC